MILARISGETLKPSCAATTPVSAVRQRSVAIIRFIMACFFSVS
jgi:nitrate reductase beta subunit